MGFCPSQCQTITLVPNPTGGCDFGQRRLTINRIAFFNCGLEIPDPMDCATIEPLFTDGSIVLSSPLRNVTWEDPETEEVLIHDCQAPARIVVKRTLSFEDTIAITEEVAGTPPTYNKYADYDFWKDKKKHRALLRFGYVNCGGDFWFALDENGELMQAYFDVFLTGQRLGGAGGMLEIKKGTVDFVGDPLDFRAPDFNLTECGIDV